MRRRAALGRKRGNGEGAEGPLIESTPLPGRCRALSPWPGLTLHGPAVQHDPAGPPGPGSAPVPPAQGGGLQPPWSPAPPAAGTALRDGERLWGGGSAQPPTAPLLGLLHQTGAPPITPNPMPAPTLSLLLQLLGPGPDFSHMAFVGLQQLLWLLPVSPRWGRPPAGLSLQHRGLQQAGGAGPHQPWGLGYKDSLGCQCRSQEYGVCRTSAVSLLEAGSAVRSRALSRGVRTSPRGAPRSRPGPCCPPTAGRSPGSTRRQCGSARCPRWDTPTLQRQTGRGKKCLVVQTFLALAK